jgi:lysyl-tRNA synthetase, class II
MTNAAATPQATDSNALIEAKIRNLQALKELGVNPYPYNFNVTHHAGALQEKYKDLPNGEVTGETVAVAGRVMSYRNSGMFIDLHDASGKIQIFSHKDGVPAELL